MIEIRSAGLKIVSQRIVGWVNTLNNGLGLRGINAILELNIINNYDNEGIPIWQSRKKEYDWKILQKTGAKRAEELNSTHRQWQRTDKGFRLSISSTDYGAYHQFGIGQATRKSVNPTQQEIERMNQGLLEDIFYGG